MVLKLSLSFIILHKSGKNVVKELKSLIKYKKLDVKFPIYVMSIYSFTCLNI